MRRHLMRWSKKQTSEFVELWNTADTLLEVVLGVAQMEGQKTAGWSERDFYRERARLCTRASTLRCRDGVTMRKRGGPGGPKKRAARVDFESTLALRKALDDTLDAKPTNGASSLWKDMTDPPLLSRLARKGTLLTKPPPPKAQAATTEVLLPLRKSAFCSASSLKFRAKRMGVRLDPNARGCEFWRTCCQALVTAVADSDWVPLTRVDREALRRLREQMVHDLAEFEGAAEAEYGG